MNPMSLLNQFRRWLGESRRNQLLAAGATLVAVATLAAVGIVIAASGEGDRQEQVVARTATPSPATEAPTQTPRRTATASPSPEPVETLAFLRDGDIWLINADGTNQRQLTQLGDVESFAWVTSSELDVVTGGEAARHLLVELQGTVRELPFPGQTAVNAGFTVVEARGSWSPDGTLYAVPIDQQVVVFDRSGAEVGRLEAGPPMVENATKDECGSRAAEPDTLVFGPLAFSPDGRRVLLAVNCASRSGAYQLYSGIYEVTLDGAINRPLGGSGPAVSPSEGLSTNFRLRAEFLAPRFSPDGASVAQMSMGGFSLCPVVRGLAVARADGTDALTLAPSALNELQGDLFGGIIDYAWSPAGDAVVASFDVSICQVAGPLEPGLTGLYILKADGAAEEKLLDVAVSSVAWSPSGDLIAFLEGKYLGEPAEPPILRILDLATRRVIDIGDGTNPAWQPQS